MEYVDGSDLAKVLAKQGKLPVHHACAYMTQVAAGLQHAHERGLVHRDIKPLNLIVTADGKRIKILDFGLVKLVGMSHVQGRVTILGQIGGTPDYLAPEQVTDFHGVDTRSDIYSLGCTFYQALTGEPPFHNIHPRFKMQWHQDVSKEPPEIESLRPELPPGLPAVIRKMMAKRPEARYQTPAEVAHALAPFSKRPRSVPQIVTDKSPVASPSHPVAPPKIPSSSDKQIPVAAPQPEQYKAPPHLQFMPPGSCPTCGKPKLAAEQLCSLCADAVMRLDQPIPGYRIVRELGRGSMGIVTLALRESDGRAYAVKTIIPSVASNHATMERFRREARILGQLRHPNIVGLRDEGEIQGMLFLAMDYIPGKNLSQLLRRDGPMQVQFASRFLCQILDALAHAHAKQFVHRGVKLSDMLVADVSGNEKVWLADFGLARIYDAVEMSGLTFNGDIGGTIAYMPPEQITEYRDAKPPADQYAAAASLYNLLTGKYIYDLPEGDFAKQLRQILFEDPVPIRNRRVDIPKGLAEAIHRALARDPADRFPTVAAFREALLPFCEPPQVWPKDSTHESPVHDPTQAPLQQPVVPTNSPSRPDEQSDVVQLQSEWFNGPEQMWQVDPGHCPTCGANWRLARISCVPSAGSHQCA